MIGIVVVLVILCLTFLLAWPLGLYIARVLEEPESLPKPAPILWIEKGAARLIGKSWTVSMGWKEYGLSFLALHAVGIMVLFALFTGQSLFSSGENFPALTAWNMAVSFVTNTNWQSYVPEATMSWSTQMIAVTVQQFISAAAGVTLLCALARAFYRAETSHIGNFWRDLVRFSLYVLLPLAAAVAVLFLATGVPQSAKGVVSYTNLEGVNETVPIGMCASQEAIKLLGTNGGGFFQANSAHPFENPSPCSNLISCIVLLLVPMALYRTFAEMVRAPRQGALLLLVVGSLFLVAVLLACLAEDRSCTMLPAHSSPFQAEGNMEGKECRTGPFWSVLWAVETTATSNGSVNCSLGSLLPLTGGVALGLIQVGEVIFGGLGTGCVGALVFLLIAVFSAGLMVGRTPEYLGKKIEAREMKPVILLALIHAALTLTATSGTLALPEGRTALSAHNARGVTEALYAYSSTAANNGSAITSLRVDDPLYQAGTSLVMCLGRLVPAVLIFFLAGALVEKKHIAESAGTLPTDSLAFGLWFAFVIVMIGALNFLPAFTLGPVVEHLSFFQNGG